MSKFKLKLNGKDHDVEVTRQGDRMHIDVYGKVSELNIVENEGASFTVEISKPDGVHQQIHGAGHVDGDQRQLWVNGQTFRYERIRQQSSGDVLDDSLSSSIPAVVSQVLVNPGDVVPAGEKLILLESMKMIIPILAPVDSSVLTIHCTVGESVQAGIPLIELEELEK